MFLLLEVSLIHFNNNNFFHICTIHIQICLFGTDDNISLQPAWCHISYCCWQTAGSVDREAEYKSVELLKTTVPMATSAIPLKHFSWLLPWHKKKVLCNTHFLSNTHHFYPVSPIQRVQHLIISQASCCMAQQHQKLPPLK